MVLTPSSDSLIDTAVFLPAENWNGKLQVVGNGGWAGTVSYPAMAAALREGYATASNDTGHRANDAGGGGMFALGHPEKITDFAYRAMHETVVKAKLITAAFYGRGPKYSYYNGCSTGGRQGLIEITKFPEDFDAASVGAPANPHVHLHAAGVERSLELMKNDAPLTEAKVETLHKAVMDSCDALDGVKDGILSNPEKCHYDPQRSYARAPMGPPASPRRAKDRENRLWRCEDQEGRGHLDRLSGRHGTASRLAPQRPHGARRRVGCHPHLGHQDKDYDWHNFDLDTEVAQADKAGIDVLTYDLSAFKAHGGKLLLYHGWADSTIPPDTPCCTTKKCWQPWARIRTTGSSCTWSREWRTAAAVRVPNQFNKMGVIERWREAGQAPEAIVASHVTGGNGRYDASAVPLSAGGRV